MSAADPRFTAPARRAMATPTHPQQPGRRLQTLPGRAAPPAPAPANPQWSMVTARQGDNLVLMPGQLYFGGRAASSRTLLGSCVAITLWHPGKKIGGMCHFLLPQRKVPADGPPEGRYGDEAVGMMVKWLRMAGTQPAEYEAHLYGGADTQPGVDGPRTGIGERNIEMGWSLIDRYGFQLAAVDVGEHIPRNVKMNLLTGQVDMHRGAAITRRTP
jgi:chemotaxis protein CheD